MTYPTTTLHLPTLEPAFSAELMPAFTGVPCVGKTELYFPPSTLHWSVRNAAVDQAKALCRTCPHVAECLEFALVRGEPDGVWGGELLRDGSVIAAYPRPGRPARLRPVQEPAAA
jgi:WhiB family transcriptional regulator, redox-sensing transcriptional regulator